LSEVIVSGYGIVTSLGIGVQSNEERLLSQSAGLTRAKQLQSNYSESHYFGEVDHSLEVLLDLIKTPIIKANCHRTNALSLIALEEAIASAGLDQNQIENAAFINASTVGGMCQDKDLYYIVNGGEDTAHIHANTFSSGACTEYITKHIGFSSFVDTINTACSSSANAIALGFQLIKLGKFDTVVVGGVDSLTKYSVNGFNSLNLLSNEKCQPFDKNRDGINLGEAAGYLVLQKEDVAKTRHASISGFGNSNDAHHSTSISDESFGPNLAIEGALNTAHLKSTDIDYINAHGTATENNDLSESTAIQQQFGKDAIFSSTKPYTGHTLAAAGAIEAIFSILSIKNQTAWGNLNFNSKDSNIDISPITENTPRSIQHVLSNSFGFGGNCTSLIISK
jgi:3-oxoacyl-(acyl-carrier-protein) synthase